MCLSQRICSTHQPAINLRSVTSVSVERFFNYSARHNSTTLFCRSTTKNLLVPPNVLTTPRRSFSGANAQKKIPGSADIEREKDLDTLVNIIKYSVSALILTVGTYYSYKHATKRYANPDVGAHVYIKSHGKPCLGGPFVLVDTTGKPRSQKDFLGSWTFFYFGFVNCPEICPIELNRMSKVVDGIRKRHPGIQIVPLFVSCDPLRDSLDRIQEYVADFHPDFVGLVGTPEQVDHVCKSYRIYYSVPDADAVKDGDYLIDHSIASFLFDPQGRFVDFFGTRYTDEEILNKMDGYVKNYEADPTWTTW